MTLPTSSRPIARVDEFGGRTVRWWDRPGSGPTVLFLGGCGQVLELWADVAQLLPGRALVAYDRPGLGGTSWPRRIPTLADELATLVELVDRIGAPVVVVAHSMAAFHAEALIRMHPDLVSGLVLADPSVEWPAADPGQPTTRSPRAVAWLAGPLRLRAFGPLGGRLSIRSQSYGGSTHRVAGRAPGHYNSPDALAMALAEAMAYGRQSWDLMRVRAHFAWPAPPAIVLSAEEGEERHRRGNQRRLASLLGADYRFVRNSRHLIMLDRPDAVARAVTDLPIEVRP